MGKQQAGQLRRRRREANDDDVFALELLVRSVLLRMHQDAFEVFGALVGGHLGYRLVPVAESYFVKVLVVRLAVDDHLYAPLLAVFCSRNALYGCFEDDFLEYVEVARVVFEILLKLWLREMMWVLF
jgi:hypothetical protein